MSGISKTTICTWTGRLDRMINTGYHVYPQEIEETIRGLPEVRDVNVKGEPDPVRGERVVAVIATSAVDHEQLIAAVDRHVRSQLASYKVPRRYTVVDELPVE
jgi:acyl-CoA synthetase (AMP-forming)/AMP-acid ligase II